jgi:hypothetical protein
MKQAMHSQFPEFYFEAVDTCRTVKKISSIEIRLASKVQNINFIVIVDTRAKGIRKCAVYGNNEILYKGTVQRFFENLKNLAADNDNILSGLADFYVNENLVFSVSYGSEFLDRVKQNT